MAGLSLGTEMLPVRFLFRAKNSSADSKSVPDAFRLLDFLAGETNSSRLLPISSMASDLWVRLLGVVATSEAGFFVLDLQKM